MPRPAHDIGAAVFAALHDDEKTALARGIRTARVSYYGKQNVDWLCCIFPLCIQPRGLGQREDEVTADDMLGTCVDLASLRQSPDWWRALGYFGEHRDRVEGLYVEVATARTAEPDYDAIGRQVYASLTSRDRTYMKKALRICRDDPDGDDDWHCALGNRGYGNPIVEGARVTDEDVQRLCEVLAEMHDVVRDDPRLHYESDWSRLIGGGFGYEHKDRIQALYAKAQMPLFECRDGTR